MQSLPAGEGSARGSHFPCRGHAFSCTADIDRLARSHHPITALPAIFHSRRTADEDGGQKFDGRRAGTGIRTWLRDDHDLGHCVLLSLSRSHEQTSQKNHDNQDDTPDLHGATPADIFVDLYLPSDSGHHIYHEPSWDCKDGPVFPSDISVTLFLDISTSCNKVTSTITLVSSASE